MAIVNMEVICGNIFANSVSLKKDSLCNSCSLISDCPAHKVPYQFIKKFSFIERGSQKVDTDANNVGVLKLLYYGNNNIKFFNLSNNTYHRGTVTSKPSIKKCSHYKKNS